MKMNGSLVWATMAVLLSGCVTSDQKGSDSRSHNPAEVLNKTWRWEATVTPADRLAVSHPDRYTIRFAENGRLQANFDCNKGGGSYTLAEGKLSFGPLMSTRMACPEGSHDAIFMRDLQRVQSFFIKDGMLFLELPLDSGTMRFRGIQ